jgi:hypothetical protein
MSHSKSPSPITNVLVALENKNSPPRCLINGMTLAE